MNYFEYFKQIAAIPHGSGNTDAISQYLVNFARDNGFEYRRDELGNVIIKRPAHPDYVDHEPVILQGHMDMVAVKEADCDKDMATEGLDLEIVGDYLSARGTSLGGDDGIGVAYILDILAGDYFTPAIEAIITVDEETSMVGAGGIDLSDITSRRMLNLDQELEGEIVVSCAGGAHMDISIPTEKEVICGRKYRVSVGNLKGGHSGSDINKGRGNAIKILASELCKLKEKIDFNIVSIMGGSVDNGIPVEAHAEIMLTKDINPILASEIMKLNGISLCFGEMDDMDTAEITVTEGAEDDYIALTNDSSRRVLECINECPNGVVAMQEADPTAVETSLNIGKVWMEEESVDFCALVRSSVESSKKNVLYELCKLAQRYNATTSISGEYPGWMYRSESPIRDIVVGKFEEMFGWKPGVVAIHAGLECGIFASKLEGLDCVSIGPTIDDIHTVNEKISLSSAERCFELVVEILKEC